MRIAGILRYTLSALLAGAAACAALWLLRHWGGRRTADHGGARRMLMVGYLAAVTQIIGLRLGLQHMRWLGGLGALNLFPLRTMLGTWQAGTWPFVYHTLGNLGWFAPLGMLLGWLKPSLRAWHALLSGALLSLALECAQLLLGTGAPDVDDILLNALGALLGFGALRLGQALWRQQSNSPI